MFFFRQVRLLLYKAFSLDERLLLLHTISFPWELIFIYTVVIFSIEKVKTEYLCVLDESSLFIVNSGLII